MTIDSIKKLKSSYKELRRTFSEKRPQDYVNQRTGSTEGLLDPENQDTDGIDDLDSASVTQSDTTSPDPDDFTSLNLHDFTHSDGITGHSTHEVEVAVQRTRRKILGLNANIDEPDAPNPDTNITDELDTPFINFEAPSTTSSVSGKEPYPKEYRSSQFKHLQMPKHVGWGQIPGSYDEQEPVPHDSKMEFESPGQQPNTESRTTSSNIPHYVPPIVPQDYRSCINQDNKLQNIRQKLFENKLSYLKIEFPEYTSMFTHPAFREGFDFDIEPSPDAAIADVKTVNLTAQVVNLTIKTEQFNSNVTDLAPSDFSRPTSHGSFERPRSFIQSTCPIPPYGDSSSVKSGRISQSFGADISASANQLQPNRGSGSSQAETLVFEETEGDVTGLREDTEAQIAAYKAFENACMINDDQRRVFSQ